MEIGKTGVRIEFLGHSGFLVSCKEGKKIAIDPFHISDSMKEKADIILITHSHPNHCSIKDIEKLVDLGNGATVVCTADCQSKVMRMEDIRMEVVELGDKLEFGNIRIETVPAYNKYKDYHPKSEGWIGYLVKIGNVAIYHAGDTDFIPEMQKLSGHGKHGNEFVALLPVSGKAVMDVEQAAEAASVMGPDLAIPMHYAADAGGSLEDAKRFVDLCKAVNINAEILEKI